MPLEVLPVELIDFDLMEKDEHNHGGDLISPLVPMVWPTSADDAQNAERSKWSMKQQRDIFLQDPTVAYMKVIDTDTGEIISLARWHYYENGFDVNKFTAWELNGSAPDADETWPAQMNAPMAKKFLNELIRERPSWMGLRPQYVLTTIMTKEPQRRRGAGSMLVNWGREQAEKKGVPAFLEAVPTAKSVYEKCGFSQVGQQTVDLSDVGGPAEVTLARMAANV